jgi:hypothetical protein
MSRNRPNRATTRAIQTGDIYITTLDDGMIDLINRATNSVDSDRITTRLASRTLRGDWLGMTGRHESAAQSDRALSLANFIALTATPGCRCEDCLDRHDLARQVGRLTHEQAEAIYKDNF